MNPGMVAAQFAGTLTEAGVGRIYGPVGDSLSSLAEAIRARGRVKRIHVRHEDAAAFAAGAEAHLTRAIAFCAGSAAPAFATEPRDRRSALCVQGQVHDAITARPLRVLSDIRVELVT